MGFFDALFGNKNQIPTVTSILPAAAKNAQFARTRIRVCAKGRGPVLGTTVTGSSVAGPRRNWDHSDVASSRPPPARATGTAGRVNRTVLPAVQYRMM